MIVMILPYDPAAVRGTVIDLGEVSGVEGSGRTEQNKLTVTLCGYISYIYKNWLCISKTLCLYIMCLWSTDAVISSTAIFVEITNNTLYGSKLYFLCYAKNH